MVKKFTILLYASAATTLIAGIIHLYKVIDDTITSDKGFSNVDILFLVGGIAQIFWVVPIIRQWGRIWYSIGIAGTIIFVLS
jgi:hypothetical protein